MQTPALDFLAGREIVLGVGGGVSAYKSAELLRRLQDIGLTVTVVPTQASLNFVGLGTWQALSGRDVPSNLWNNIHEVPHIKLAKQTSAIIIAPATYDLIGKIANGIANDLLTNIVSASKAPLILVPAMHTEMWLNPINQENISKLRRLGVHVVEPEVGRMTGDDSGIGRYPEIGRLITEITSILNIKSDYLGRRVVVTAGGTREFLDPIRFIGNLSSGKQGYAFAEIARSRGADVTLISANSHLPAPEGVKIVNVENANEMLTALKDSIREADLLVMSAAVADVRPAQKSVSKLKKRELKAIDVVENPDLLKEIYTLKDPGLLIIAFAAETDGDIEAEAKRKLFAKGANFIYANDVSNGQVFGMDETAGFILDDAGNRIEFPRSSKDTLAQELLNLALNKLS